MRFSWRLRGLPFLPDLFYLIFILTGVIHTAYGGRGYIVLAFWDGLGLIRFLVAFPAVSLRFL